MKLSVVIPTYNRRESLAKCLAALEAQSWRDERFEVIVVDDGSTDGTKELAAGRAPGGAFDLKYFRLEHRGPSAVRNEGLRRASGEILLYIGDDILAGPELLREHLRWHAERPGPGTAVFGHVTWSPELKVTPFMHWLEHGGPGFRYYQFPHGEPVDVLWTCNISFKRGFLLANGGFFDEDFPYAAMEDIELGHRLARRGLKIIYNSSASAWHFHPTDFVRYTVRQRLVGRSTRLLWEKFPELRREPEPLAPWKRALRLCAPLLKWGIQAADAAGLAMDPRVYDFVLYHYYLKGLGEGLKDAL